MYKTCTDDENEWRLQAADKRLADVLAAAQEVHHQLSVATQDNNTLRQNLIRTQQKLSAIGIETKVGYVPYGYIYAKTCNSALFLL